MKIRWIAAGVSFFLAFGVAVSACTTAVISGTATADGRPLLWKNRDSDKRLNRVVFVDDGRYPFVGLANGDDPAGFQIWAGVNSAGFAIMNSASYNIETADTQDEGRFMRFALQSCATVEDFQALLKRTDGRARDTSANFGVIDARGGSAYFETGRQGFVRFDASDERAAPGGVLIRTNFSASGDEKLGTGFWRERRARRLTDGLLKKGKMDAGTLLTVLARDIGNDAIGPEPREQKDVRPPRWVFTGDSICRYDTVSAALVAGVRPGENPLLSTFWVIPGQPIAGAAVPLWVSAGAVPPALGEGAEETSMARAIEEICNLLYPDRRGDLARYLDAGLVAGAGTELTRTIRALEEANLREAGAARETWLGSAPGPEEVRKLQDKLVAETCAALRGLGKKMAASSPGRGEGGGGPAAPSSTPAKGAKVGCGS